MNINFKPFSTVLVVLVAGSFLLGLINLGGCGKKGGDSVARKQNHQAREILSKLEQAFNRENYSGVLDLVHPDYRQFNNELRADLRDVFSDFTQLELEFYSSRVNDKKDGMNVVARWNLRWVCTTENTDIGCSSKGQTVRRKGRTTFGLAQNPAGEWKLKAQRGDRVLGGLAPGNRMHP